MKTIRKMALVGLLGAAMSSCAPLYTTLTVKAASIEVGMTKEEVKAKMGAPRYRRFDGNRDEWEYRTLYDADNDVVVLHFYNNRVVSMDSFRELRPHCPAPEKKK